MGPKKEGKAPKMPNQVPVRKRLKHKKRHKKQTTQVNVGASTSSAAESEVPAMSPEAAVNEVESDGGDSSVGGDVSESDESGVKSPCPPPQPFLGDHDYSSPTPSSMSRPSSGMSNISDSLSISLQDLTEGGGSDTCSRLASPTSPIPSSCGSPSPVSPTIMCASTPNKEDDSDAKSPQQQPPPPSPDDLLKLLLHVREKLLLMLPTTCIPMADSKGVHVLIVGPREEKAVQRQVTVYPDGSVRILVHGEEYPHDSILKSVRAKAPLAEEGCGYFADRVIDIVSNVRMLEICAGMDYVEYKAVWSVSPQGNVEGDVFKENRYRETLRSTKCSKLVPVQSWRCKECTKLLPILKRKLQTIQTEEPHKNTNVRYMAEKQKEILLEQKQKKIKGQKQIIDRLQCKMKTMIQNNGVNVDESLSEDLQGILHSGNLTPNQSLFLQQQVKAIKCKKSCGMRWHPTLIRMALSLYLKAPGAYKELCESGFVKLPTSRTLFDYSHVTKVTPGIDRSVVGSVVKRANSEEHTHKQYHVLMADEMYISKNLVLSKASGELIGFKDLDDIDQELADLQAHLDNPNKPVEPELASKVMVFMIKGVSSSLKHVVASYPVCNPSPRQIYFWAREVIGILETNLVMVIAFVCDGCPSNRAFIKLHKPATVTSSGVAYDTINKYDPSRRIFFFSDVPHLLKTIRNAFFNSRLNRKNKKKSPRLLKKNGQVIVWDTIIKLFLSKKNKTLRKSYKLNAQNVFPDSFSKMKVKPAAQIMSRTVGTDILSQGWAATSETVEFIYKVNDWFDLLNGAFSTHGLKKNNPRLNPYTIKDVEDFENKVAGNRFQELLDFLKYLEEWKEEVQSRKNNTLSTSAMSIGSDLGVQPLEGEGSFHALNDSDAEPEDDGDSSKNLLPHQTLLGIEMSVRSFIDATTFLLKAGVKFVNARVFCQDPLEQNFGRQRMAGGGSSNPNLQQFLHKQRAFSTIGELSAANKRGNTEVLSEECEMISEPLPKRKKRKEPP